MSAAGPEWPCTTTVPCVETGGQSLESLGYSHLLLDTQRLQGMLATHPTLLATPEHSLSHALQTTNFLSKRSSGLGPGGPTISQGAVSGCDWAWGMLIFAAGNQGCATIHTYSVGQPQQGPHNSTCSKDHD